MLYEDENVLRPMLQKLFSDAQRYEKEVKGKDKGSETETGEDDEEA